MNRYAIGRRIEAYRDKMKMSTQELAERINRSQATISRIENGKQGLTFELLSRIASELRIHPFALLSDEPLRSSVLLPATGKREGEYAPNLLANALHSGRIRRNLRIDAAAAMVAISQSELESIELALSSPKTIFSINCANCTVFCHGKCAYSNALAKMSRTLPVDLPICSRFFPISTT